MELNVSQVADSFRAHVKVTNETGHKLPSGYPEGRRIWINLQAFNESGTLIYESGAYNSSTAVLTEDADAKSYEIKPWLSPDWADSLSLTAGPSFHFVLNDTVYSDNRIPARGFTNAAYDSIGSPVVGYSYPNGQYWDDTYYGLPSATRKVVAKLFYQTTTKEFIEFLRDENVTDTRGSDLHTWWSANGKSPPELMRADSVEVAPSALTVDLTVFLEGAYMASDSMNVTGLFHGATPLDQPFSDPGMNGTILEHDTTLSVSTWHTNYIDWILVSLRTDSSAASQVFQTPAILRKDGSVVDTSGTALTIHGLSAGSYYVVVRARNHLPVMSASAVDFSTGSGTWDFSTGPGSAFSNDGPAMKVMSDSRTVLVSGDINMDGQITAADFNLWLLDTKAVVTGFVLTDLNLDGQVTAADFNLWLVSTKAVLSSQVP
jgi:hypothetical protein